MIDMLIKYIPTHKYSIIVFKGNIYSRNKRQLFILFRILLKFGSTLIRNFNYNLHKMINFDMFPFMFPFWACVGVCMQECHYSGT